MNLITSHFAILCLRSLSSLYSTGGVNIEQDSYIYYCITAVVHYYLSTNMIGLYDDDFFYIWWWWTWSDKY